MKSVERTLIVLFTQIREQLEDRYVAAIAQVGGDAGELVASAFGYVAGGVLAGRVQCPENGHDLSCLIASKAAKMVCDEARRLRRRRGVRSVRASRSLDAVRDQDHRQLVDMASWAKWRGGRADEDRELFGRAAIRVLYRVFDLCNVSRRNRLVYTDIVLRGMRPVDVAMRRGLSRGNCDVIVNRINTLLKKHGRAVMKELLADGI